MDYIELNAFLKSKALAATGGRAKAIIRSGVVTVNGAVELRNKKKLYNGDVVIVDGEKYVVEI